MIASEPVRVLSLALLALVLLAAVRGIGLSGGPLDDQPTVLAGDGVRTRATVAYVLDGDTVAVTTRDGENVRVRLLGVSAPEIPHPGKAGDCYGPHSTAHLEQLLTAGAQVVLVGESVQADVDDYGRWLRYVEVDGRDVGRAQIGAGAALARESTNPVSSRHGAYLQAEDAARGRGSGMWTACR
jgi:micrococcal nuclease